MKICPVCQYEEEQDSEVSCAICGSDLESSAPIDEVPTETEEVIETTEEPSVSDEEKLLEETLAATEVDDTGSTDEPSDAGGSSVVSIVSSGVSIVSSVSVVTSSTGAEDSKSEPQIAQLASLSCSSSY